MNDVIKKPKVKLMTRIKLGKEETLAYLQKVQKTIKDGKAVLVNFLGGAKVYLYKVSFPPGFDNEVVEMNMFSKSGPLKFSIARVIFKSKVNRAVVKYVYNEEKNLYALKLIAFGETDLKFANDA